MLSAMYLDPRFCFELSDAQKEVAKTEIRRLSARIMGKVIIIIYGTVAFKINFQTLMVYSDI